MVNERDDEPLISEESESHQNILCVDSIDINNSAHHSECPGEEEGNKEQGCCKKVAQALQEITIEPIIFLNVLGWTVQSSISTNLLLAKVCREQQYGTDICANLSSHHEEQASVQRIVSTINMYIELLTNIPGVFFVLFLGSWSDKYGRKIPMTLPLIGSFLATSLYLMNAYWTELPSMYMLLGGVPRALTGGFITLLMATYSYMADITTIGARTMRIAFMDLGMGLGAPLGLLLGDFLFYRLGYEGLYGVSGLFFLIAIIYTIVRIEDTRGPFSKHHLEVFELAHRPVNMVKDLFDIENVKRTCAIALKPRPNRGRTKIILLMGAMCCLVFIFGTGNIGYLYAKRKFGWDYNQYVHLSLVDILMSLVGTSFALPVLSYHLQVDDCLLGLLGCASKICSLVIEGIALYPWFLYLGSVVSCIGSLPMVVTRSIISKSVPEGELGKVFSMLASWESLIPLLSNPLYTLVYNATIEDFPGTVYFMSTIFFIFASVIYVWIFFHKRVQQATPHIHEEGNIPEVEA